MLLLETCFPVPALLEGTARGVQVPVGTRGGGGSLGEPLLHPAPAGKGRGPARAGTTPRGRTSARPQRGPAPTQDAAQADETEESSDTTWTMTQNSCPTESKQSL